LGESASQVQLNNMNGLKYLLWKIVEVPKNFGFYKTAKNLPYEATAYFFRHFFCTEEK
jgi:hypothetical protein